MKKSNKTNMKENKGGEQETQHTITQNTIVEKREEKNINIILPILTMEEMSAADPEPGSLDYRALNKYKMLLFVTISDKIKKYHHHLR